MDVGKGGGYVKKGRGRTKWINDVKPMANRLRTLKL